MVSKADVRQALPQKRVGDVGFVLIAIDRQMCWNANLRESVLGAYTLAPLN
jgi:hypothetical protein